MVPGGRLLETAVATSAMPGRSALQDFSIPSLNPETSDRPQSVPPARLINGSRALRKCPASLNAGTSPGSRLWKAAGSMSTRTMRQQWPKLSLKMSVSDSDVPTATKRSALSITPALSGRASREPKLSPQSG